jgi:predicted Zn-dependent protease
VETSLANRVKRAGSIYRRALVAIPGCTLLYVAYAECMESVGELDSARAALVSLVCCNGINYIKRFYLTMFFFS